MMKPHPNMQHIIANAANLLKVLNCPFATNIALPVPLSAKQRFIATPLSNL